MSKLKFLLLWWIFTLVWIFNFSSAYELWPTYTYNSASYFENGYIWFKVDNSDCSVIQIITSDYSVIQDFHPTVWEVFLYKDHADFNGGIITFYGGSSCSIKLTYLLPDPPIIRWWTTALTPAFDWLKSSVSQIIPLVIYIWIWILLAVLWFYAIRRLVNWLWKKINSVFRSKRW